MNRPLDALREQLPAHPSSVGRARRLLRGTAGDVPEELVEAAELLVSELVSNAVVHAGTPIEIRVSVTGATSIYVAVTDGSPHHPVARHYADTAGTGRGLRLLTEMSDDWGVSIGDTGKTVWFRVSTDEAGTTVGPPPEPDAGTRPAPGDTVTVQLRSVPLTLHASWQEVAAALLREYLLVTMEEANADQELTRHAACSDAMALLTESIHAASTEGARGPVGEDPRADVPLEVPEGSVAHFATLDDTLDRALRLAETNQLLTTPTDPEMRAFRHWVCREVHDQAEGRAPTPWRSA